MDHEKGPEIMSDHSPAELHRQEGKEREATLMRGMSGVREHYVQHAHLTEVKADMEWLATRDNKASEGGCMLLTGQSGSGKSKFIEEFCLAYPRRPHALVDQRGNRSDHAPVICVPVPDSTMKGLTKTLYQVLSGIEAPNRMDRFGLKEAVKHFTRQMDTKLIIFEETHQVINRKTDKVTMELGDFFKDLLNEGQFCIVIVGTDEAKLIVTSNPELERRVLLAHELVPFAWDDPDQRRDFKDLLDTFDDRLEEIFGQRSGLTKPELALRIYKATNGVVGLVAKLLENAGKFAARESASNPKVYVGMTHLRKAFDGSNFHARRNPFIVTKAAKN